MRRSRTAFQASVARAFASLPEDFRPYLENVVIQVEDWPSDALLEEAGVEPDDTLYGIYLGTPLTERGNAAPALPDRILIFRGPLEADFEDGEALEEEIAITVVHEVAHHFGIDEDRLEELGFD